VVRSSRCRRFTVIFRQVYRAVGCTFMPLTSLDRAFPSGNSYRLSD
jgi:hypothetical protein